MRTVPVYVQNPSNKTRVRINALLDDGAQITIIDEGIVKELKLKQIIPAEAIQIRGVRGIKAGTSNKIVRFWLINNEQTSKYEIVARVLKEPCGNLKPTEWSQEEQAHLKGIRFPTPIGNKG